MKTSETNAKLSALRGELCTSKEEFCRKHFRNILHEFINRYPFNPQLFEPASEEANVT